MKLLVHEKEKAVELRKKGHTYKEILDVIPVAKSSLSLWLKDLPLTKSEKIALKDRKNNNISRGRIKIAGILHTRRLVREKDQLLEAQDAFQKYAPDPLFHTGLALYWAEGGKRTNQWQFMNSDADMQNLMIKWLVVYANIKKSDLRFRLYVHKAYQSEECDAWWATKLHVQRSQFLKTIIKPSGLGVKKRPNYRGCLRIEVRSSKPLLNKMRFWQKMLVEFYQKQ
jgi:hypothetical protein